MTPPNNPPAEVSVTEWDYISVSVRRIANGFLVREQKNASNNSAYSDELFYPTMAAVEGELLFRLKAAIALDMSGAEREF